MTAAWDEERIRRELEIPEIGPHGLHFDLPMTYSVMRSLRENELNPRGLQEVWIPADMMPHVLVKNYRGRWEYREVPRWSDQREQKRAYYEDLESENRYLKQKLERYEG